MGPKIRDIENSTALKNGTTVDSSGATVGYVGMIDSTRDKIVHNLYPEVCIIGIPGTGTCDALWHCDSGLDNCVNRINNATLINTTATLCTWQIPYCEFSTWATGEPYVPEDSEDPADPGSPGGGTGGTVGAGTTDETSGDEDEEGDDSEGDTGDDETSEDGSSGAGTPTDVNYLWIGLVVLLAVEIVVARLYFHLKRK